MTPRPRSLVLATDINVLPVDREMRRDGDHLIVRTPSNPRFWWGNFVVFDDASRQGDGARWEASFDAAFADLEEVRHRTFTWDRADGEEGELAAEFAARGYTVERTIGLAANPGQIRPHPRADPDLVVRALSPTPGGDEPLWSATVELQIDDHDPAEIPTAEFAEFSRGRLAELRALFVAEGDVRVQQVLTPGGIRARVGQRCPVARGHLEHVRSTSGRTARAVRRRAPRPTSSPDGAG